MNSFIHKTGYSGPLGAASVHLIRFSQLTGLSVSHFVTQSASLSVRFSVRFQSVSRLTLFQCAVHWSERQAVSLQLFRVTQPLIQSFHQPDSAPFRSSVRPSVSRSVSQSVGRPVSKSVSHSVSLRSFVFLFVRLISQSIYQ